MSIKSLERYYVASKSLIVGEESSFTSNTGDYLKLPDTCWKTMFELHLLQQLS